MLGGYKHSFLFFSKLAEKNLLRLEKICKCRENGIACLRKGKPSPAGKPLHCLKSQEGASVKEGWGRTPRCLANSWYQGSGTRFIPWGVGRVTERGFLVSQSTYFLCRTTLARHAPQA